MRARAPCRNEFRAVGDQQQNAAVDKEIDEEVEQLQRRRVDPLRVLDEDAERQVGGRKQEFLQQAEGFGHAAGRSRVRRGGVRQAELGAQKRDGSFRLVGIIK